MYFLFEIIDDIILNYSDFLSNIAEYCRISNCDGPVQNQYCMKCDSCPEKCKDKCRDDDTVGDCDKCVGKCLIDDGNSNASGIIMAQKLILSTN